MSYTPGTDFIGLWRAVAGGVQKLEMPGLDFLISALGRSGIINVTVSSIAPGANQSTTAWFQPATPSYSAEGGFQLWNAIAAAYQPATMRLFLEMLAAAEKVAAVPTAISSLLDTLSAVQGAVAFRGAAGWQALAPGVAGQILSTGGAAANPSWANLLTSNSLTNAIGGDIALGAANTFTDGPSVAQGNVGTWLAFGQVMLTDTANATTFNAKLWDGATVIASGGGTTSVANGIVTVSLAGVITTPAGNIKITARDNNLATGVMKASGSGQGKDSMLTVVRIA